MGKILAVAVWPAGIAAVLLIAALLARRSGPARAVPPGLGSRRARWDITPGTAGGSASGTLLRETGRFLLLIVAGTIAVYAVMAVLGLLVVHTGHVIDKPVNHWVSQHLTGRWTREMMKATEVGDTWTTRAAVVTAAVCMAVTWRRQRWLPAVAVAALAVVQRLLTHVIHLTDPRVGPPGFPHGVFPSGGSERSVVFYGLIAYLLWHEFSGRRRAAIWAAAVVAALAFNEGYSRLYLGMHWTTDVLSGWIYGLLLLTVFISAVRLIAGPARSREAGLAGEPAVAQQATAAAGEGPQ
jgi:membrane-associated phospholipid phosphatase